MPRTRPTRAPERQADRELVRRMVAGDEAAFETFCDDYIPILYRFATTRLRGAADLVPDVVQTTLCKAIAGLETFRGEAALTTWLCSCCRNEIAAHFRRAGKRGAEVELDEEQPPALPAQTRAGTADADPLQATLGRELAERVHEALDDLPPRYGKALEWKYLEELPVKEIARRLGVGPKAAESLLTRARLAFRRVYDRAGNDAAAVAAAPIAGPRMVVRP